MRHSSVRLDSGDSLARARTKSASVSAHAHRTPCRIRGCLRTLRVRLRRIYPPKASLSAAHFASLSTHRRASRPARFGFVALTRSACQRHMVGQREGRNGRDAILCVRNRSQIGRNKMRPSRDWRKCQVCALLMGRRNRGRETYRGRLGGTPRPTVGHLCASLVCGSSVGASGNACAVSNGMCRQRARGEAKRMRTGAREDGWMRKTPPKRRGLAQGGIPTKPDTPLRRMDCADQDGRVARAASVAAPRTAGRRRANRGG